jgi:hypothetical protein
MLALTACGTLEVGIEYTATTEGTRLPSVKTTITPDRSTESTVSSLATQNAQIVTQVATQSTPEPFPKGTPTPYLDMWSTYSNATYAISLQYPADWEPVPGFEDPDGHPIKLAAINGFFHITALEAPNIEEAAMAEAEHHLQPYGSQPIIENLQIQGQEARLIMPSADQPIDMNFQAALIVRYPQPMTIGGSTYHFFVLWVDQSHIRTIASTLSFGTNPTPTVTAIPVQPVVWSDLPPGLVYVTSDGLWLINRDEQPVLIHNNPLAQISPDGRRVLSYDALQQDLWLLDLSEGSIWRLTNTPDRRECCFRWWPQHPNTVLFSSMEENTEPAPGLMGYLSAVNLDGAGYQILDSEHDTGPGQFAPSPDGQTIAYGGGSIGWLYRGNRSEAFDPVEHGLSVRDDVEIAQPAWSPNGARMAWIIKGNLAADGDLRTGIGVFDLDAHTARVLHPYVTQGVGWPPAPVWSPDGAWLAFSDSSASDRAGLWVARTGGLWEEYHLGLGGNPIWSPDGKWLAFQSISPEGVPAYMLAAVGTWELYLLDLPFDRYGMLVDWINPAMVR